MVSARERSESVVRAAKRYKSMESGASRRVGSTQEVARRALRLAQANARMFESKHLDSYISSTGMSSAFTAYHLTAIGQGDNEEERLGLNARMSGLKLNLTARPSTSATSATYLRVMVIVKKTPGNALSSAEVLQDDTTGRRHYSIAEWKHRYAHKVLYDELICCDSGGSDPGYNGITRQIWVPIPKKHQTIRFDGASAVETNSLHLVLISNQATNTPGVEFNRRLYFKDA